MIKRGTMFIRTDRLIPGWITANQKPQRQITVQGSNTKEKQTKEKVC